MIENKYMLWYYGEQDKLTQALARAIERYRIGFGKSPTCVWLNDNTILDETVATKINTLGLSIEHDKYILPQYVAIGRQNEK